MIVHIFRNYNSILQLFLFVAAAVALWFTAFSHRIFIPEGLKIEWGYNLFYHVITQKSIVSSLVAFVWVILQALFLNFLLSKNNIIPRKNYLTALIYILLMSSDTKLLSLHPILFSNTFLLLMLNTLFNSKSKDVSIKEMFLAGLLVGLASLFYLKSIIFILFLWLFLVILQVYKWREWLVGIIGFITVYLYLFTAFLLTDRLIYALNTYIDVFENFIFQYKFPKLSEYQYLYGIILGFFSLMAMINISLSSREKLIFIRKLITAIVWLFLISLISFLLNINNISYDFAFIILPLSVLVSLYFLNIRKSIIAELFMLILITAIILQRIFTA